MKKFSLKKITLKKIKYRKIVKKFSNNILELLKEQILIIFLMKAKNIFFKEEYSVTRLVDRMGMRLEAKFRKYSKYKH